MSLQVLRDRAKQKLKAGVAHEFLADGFALAAYHIEAGSRSFAEYARGRWLTTLAIPLSHILNVSTWA